MFGLALIALVLAGLPGREHVRAAAGDFDLDFTAAESDTYHHTGPLEGNQIGSAEGQDLGFDDRTIGVDVVESLEARDFDCSDRVIFLTEIVVDGSDQDQTIFLTYDFASQNTGQKAVGYSDIVAVGISELDFPGTQSTDTGNVGIRQGGDSETATLISETLVGGAFGAGATSVIAVVKITDLDAGEHLIVRTDVRFACFGAGPTGNLHAEIIDATYDSNNNGAVDAGDAKINVGNQTVPMIGFQSNPTPTPSPTPSPSPTPTLPPAPPDVSLTKDGPATALPGDQITYTLLVTNNSITTAADNVSVVDTLPAGTTFISATPGQGTCTLTTCDLGTLPGTGGAAYVVPITIVVQVNPGTSGTLVNTACVSTTTPGDNPANNCDTTTTTIPTPTPTLPPGTDITVDKIGPATALPGNQITYNITVSNIGSVAADGVFALDNLPVGTTFVSATPSQGSCAFVSCSLGTIAAGSSATITIVAQVNPGATGTLTNTVCVSTTTPETNSNNNCDTTTTTIPTPTPTPPVVTPTPPVMTPTPTPPVITPTPPPPIVDILVTKIDLPDPVFAGSNLTYLISVTNMGPAAADAVVAVDNLPAGVTFISATPSQGSCSFASCSLGTIPAGGVVTITIIVRVNPGSTGTLTNTVCVSTTTNEPNLSNNCDTATTTILIPTPTPSPSPTPTGPTPTPPPPRANISLVKVDSPDPVIAGGTLTYGISVMNAGPDTATNVIVTDALPAGVTLISATPSQGTCNGTTCSLGDVLAGDSVAIAFVVTVDAGVSGDIENIACAATSTSDPDLSDNCDDETTTVNPPGSPTPTALPVISPPAGPGELPPTGGFFDAGSLGSWLMLTLGAALLIGGSTAVILSRRNKEAL